jgi:hypothetical protein
LPPVERFYAGIVSIVVSCRFQRGRRRLRECRLVCWRPQQGRCVRSRSCFLICLRFHGSPWQVRLSARTRPRRGVREPPRRTCAPRDRAVPGGRV